MEILAILHSILRGSTPLIFAALGGLTSERSGVVQIALEGMMLIGALFGAIVAYYTQSPWLGLLAAACGGLLIAIIYAFFVLYLYTDQIIAGTAINIFAFGFAPFITKIVFDSTGSTPSLALENRFQLAPEILAFIAVALIYYFYHKTKIGLLLRFSGERPDAVQAAGYSVFKIRLVSLAVCGLLAGLGGGSLSLFLSSSFSPNMTAGRGFIALAALIFGRWKPIPTFIACLLFSTTDAIQSLLQGTTLGMTIPVQFIQIIPYVFTIIILSGFFKNTKSRNLAPMFLGVPLKSKD